MIIINYHKPNHKSLESSFLMCVEMTLNCSYYYYFFVGLLLTNDVVESDCLQAEFRRRSLLFLGYFLVHGRIWFWVEEWKELFSDGILSTIDLCLHAALVMFSAFVKQTGSFICKSRCWIKWATCWRGGVGGGCFELAFINSNDPIYFFLPDSEFVRLLRIPCRSSEGWKKAAATRGNKRAQSMYARLWSIARTDCGPPVKLCEKKKKKKKRVEKEEGDVIAHVRVFLTLLFRNPFLMQPLSLASGAHLDDTFFSLWSFICGRNDIREPVFFFFFFFSEAARGAPLNLCSLSLTHSTVLEIGGVFERRGLHSQ